MRTVRDLSEAERSVLAELRRRIDRELPGRGVRLTVFGSRARGDAEPDSDMDVLVEVETRRLSPEDRRTLRRTAGEVSIDSGIVVSLLIVDEELKAERGDFSIFDNIRDEGIRA